MRKSFIMESEDSWYEEGEEDFELHDGRIYITDHSICLPGRQYLRKCQFADGEHDVREAILPGGERIPLKKYVCLGKREEQRKKGEPETVYSGNFLFRIILEVREDILSIGYVWRRVDFRKGRKEFTGSFETERYSFNMQTGRNFILPRRYLCGDRFLPYDSGAHVQGFSFLMDEGSQVYPDEDGGKLPKDILDVALGLLLDRKEKQLGYRPTVSANGFKTDIGFLASVNANPDCNQLMSLKPYFLNSYYFNRFRKQANPLKELCGLLNLPYCTSVRKMFTADPESIFVAADILSTGLFTRLDNVVKLASARGECRRSIFASVYHGIYTNAFFLPEGERAEILRKVPGKKSSPLVRDLDYENCGESAFSVKGMQASFVDRLFELYRGDETKVTNALLREGYFVYDCLSMLEHIEQTLTGDKAFNILRRKGCLFGRNKGQLRRWLDKMYLSGFDRHAHGLIAQADRWLRNLNKRSVKISYSPEESALEEQRGQYRFMLPKKTGDLLALGAEMDICVGSYSDSALYKYLDIVYVRDSEGVAVCCMELTTDLSAVRQVRGPRNDEILRYSELGEEVYGWLKRHHIDCQAYEFDGPHFKKRETA